eukprot:NODE_4330_length_826_cov_28.514801_g4002_i0.p1 GENE.NODE_4330_length_826_cov_28.514801_g4002_i0~~NODE_4330_length_826_cov_28.514801_g4002_i0.p1  ORF type:complete len:230 (-),score=66.19 NODE_4330_length_826_cov_28.514801_g4002_i0:135-749(-)
MSKPVLHYFPVPGRGLPIRMALFYGGIDFDLKEITFAELKADDKTYLFGTVPMLEIDGMKFTQWAAQLIYVGTKVGLLDPAPLEVARFLEVHCAIEDFYARFSPTLKLSGEEQAKARAELNEFSKKHFPKLEAHVASFGGQGFCFGNKLTLSDIMIYRTHHHISSGVIDGVSTDLMDHPHLLRSVEAVKADVKCKEFIDRFLKK